MSLSQLAEGTTHELWTIMTLQQAKPETLNPKHDVPALTPLSSLPARMRS